MHSLPLLHRLNGQPVILVGTGDAAEAKQRLIERVGGCVVDEQNTAARLAFVAVDQPAAIVSQLKARGVLVNVVDRPDLCDFTVPSLLERGPVLVAVGTGGVSAGLAKALRLRLEGLLPDGLGGLAEALGAARAQLRHRWPDPRDRRRALDQALTHGGVLDPLGNGDAASVQSWLAGAVEAAVARHEFSVSSDDPDDLTLRQARWLGQADMVAHEPEVTAAILNRARADAVRRLIRAGDVVPPEPGTLVIIRRG